MIAYEVRTRSRAPHPSVNPQAPPPCSSTLNLHSTAQTPFRLMNWRIWLGIALMAPGLLTFWTVPEYAEVLSRKLYYHSGLQGFFDPAGAAEITRAWEAAHPQPIDLYTTKGRQALVGSLSRTGFTHGHPVGFGRDSDAPFRVAVGYNANLDLIAPALQTVPSPPQDLVPKDYATPSTMAEVQATLAHFLSRGAAAERYIADEALFQTLVEAAGGLVAAKRSTGGNAALMANRLAYDHCSVLLGGWVGDELAELLHPNVQIVGGSKGPDTDEVHLILEYRKGAKFGSWTAPRANRLILVRDAANAEIRAAEAFHAALESFEPELVIISGLHLVEAEDRNTRQDRLNTISAYLRDIPGHVPIHFELASIADDTLLADIAQIVLPHVDSLGLNEEEATALYTHLFGGSSIPKASGTWMSPGDVQAASNALGEVMAHYHNIHHHNHPESAELHASRTRIAEAGGHAPGVHTNDAHHLTRIHFHVLAFHIVMQEHQPVGAAGARWYKPPESSAAAGSLVTTRVACGNEVVEVDDTDILLHSLTTEGVRLYVDFGWDPQSKPIADWLFDIDVEAVQDAFRAQHGPDADNELDEDSVWAAAAAEDPDTAVPPLTVSAGAAPVLVCKEPKKTVGLGDTISSTGLLYSLGLRSEWKGFGMDHGWHNPIKPIPDPIASRKPIQ